MLKEKILTTIKKYNMIKSGDKIILGVSGGPDSISMLNILYELKDNLKALDLVKDVKVKKKLGFVLEITVEEEKLLYFIRSKDEYMASSFKTYKLNNVNGVPTLINFVPENVEKGFVKEFSKVDKKIISLVSEIEYSKTAYDKKRFLLFMNDGNEVYITVTKTDVLNKYIDIVKKLSNKNGILYLDSGNYFEIKK